MRSRDIATFCDTFFSKITEYVDVGKSTPSKKQLVLPSSPLLKSNSTWPLRTSSNR